MNNWNPDGFLRFFRPFSVWVEEQKVPVLE